MRLVFIFLFIMYFWNRFYEQLNHVKILELFEDNDLDGFQKLLSKSNSELKEVLLMRNKLGHTPLHITCFHGYKKLTLQVIKLHWLFNISLDVHDDQGNTPLNLLSSHGYLDMNLDLIDGSQDDQLQMVQNIQRDKLEILQQFFLSESNLKADIRKSVQDGQNNPLHWCIYYGDYHCGRFLFEQYPLIILRQNDKHLNPLEMVIKNPLKFFAKNETKKLVFHILRSFILSLFNLQGQYKIDIYKNAKWTDKRFVSKINKYLNNRSFVRFSLSANVDQNQNQVPHLQNIKPSNNPWDTTSDILNRLQIGVEQYDQQQQQNQVNDHQENHQAQIKRRKIMVFNDEISENKTNTIIFLHKLLLISTFLNSKDLVELFMTKLHLNPFYKTIENFNGLIYSASQNYTGLIRYMLSFEYIDQNYDPLDITNKINYIGGTERNTALHYAVQNNNFEVYQLLIDNGAEVMKQNYFDLVAFEMSSDEKFAFQYEDYFNKFEDEKIKELLEDPWNADTFNEDLLKLINENYQYILVSHSVEDNYKDTLMYQQLLNLQRRFQDISNLAMETNMNKSQYEIKDMPENVSIKYIKPFNFQEKGIYWHFFLIKFSETLIKTFATILRFKMYNKKLGYNQEYSIKFEKEYSKFRDFQVHKIYMYLLNIEFNVNDLKSKGIIEEVFPLHEYWTRNNILSSFQKQKKTMLFDSLKTTIKQSTMKPFNSIAFYYGCDMALYVSFVITVISYLLPLSLVGVIVFALDKTIYQSYQKFLQIIYVIFVILWLLALNIKFKQKESAHAYYWNTENYQKNDIVQDSYWGFYAISQISNRIKVTNNFKTVYRKLLLEIPLMLFAFGVIGLILYFVIRFNNQVTQLNLDLSYKYQTLNHEYTILLYQALIGAGNGAAIFLFTEIYILLCQFVVYLENYKFKREENNSYVLLNFVFYFLINYSMLLYYALYRQDFNLLATNFVTIMLSKNFLFLLKNNLIPYLLYAFQKWWLLNQYKLFRQQDKDFYIQQIRDNKVIKEFLERFDITLYLDEKLFFDRKTNKLVLVSETSQWVLDQVIKKEQADLLISQLLNTESIQGAFKDLSAEDQQTYLVIEKSLILQDQVELTMKMTDPPELNFLWIELATQMGFIAFFSISYPIFTLYGYLITVLHVYLLFNQMVTIFKRQMAEEKANIGVWRGIFQIMIYLALIINTAIIVFTKNQTTINGVITADQDSIDQLLQTLNIQNTRYIKFIILVIFEHILMILIMVIQSAIQDKPRWLKLIYKIQEYKQNVDVLRQKNEEIKQEVPKIIKNEKTLQDMRSSVSEILQQISSKQELEQMIAKTKTRRFFDPK